MIKLVITIEYTRAKPVSPRYDIVYGMSILADPEIWNPPKCFCDLVGKVTHCGFSGHLPGIFGRPKLSNCHGKMAHCSHKPRGSRRICHLSIWVVPNIYKSKSTDRFFRKAGKSRGDNRNMTYLTVHIYIEILMHASACIYCNRMEQAWNAQNCTWQSPTPGRYGVWKITSRVALFGPRYNNFCRFSSQVWTAVMCWPFCRVVCWLPCMDPATVALV